MVKYLIQDIIPAERRHPKKEKSEGPTSTASHTTRLHPAAHQKPRTPLHHAMPPEAAPEVIKHHELPLDDPREIIAREIEKGEVYAPPVTQELTKNISSEPEQSAGAWPYNNPRNATTSQHILRLDVSDEETISTWKNWIPWIIVPAIIGVVAMVGLSIFSKSTVSIVPKKDIIPMNLQMTTFKAPADGELGFAVMKFASNETREVAATGEKTVTAKASGKIVIYNEQTTAQRLIKNTRFQSPAGKIYRINESVNIPKATTVSGKLRPGSHEITVYADEAGPEYNSDPVDFTVPGLKGSAIYEKVYARSKGAITGGASGTTKTVSDQDLKQAGEDIRIQLETALRTKARGDLAPSQITYDGGIFMKLSPATLSAAPASSPDKAVVASDGEIYMLTFDREALTQAIMKSLVPTHKGEPIVIKNLDSFSITINKMTADELWAKEEISFTIKGTPEIEWTVNTEGIKNALLGTPKDNFNATLAEFRTIERAKANVRPRWKSEFPEDSERILVEIVESIPR